jgi:hypothetical protein
MLSSSAHRAEPPRNLSTLRAIPTMLGERARGVHALVDLLTVFISHKHEDNALAVEVKNVMHTNGASAITSATACPLFL